MMHSSPFYLFAYLFVSNTKNDVDVILVINEHWFLWGIQYNILSS
jgi:hypothetical protein